MTTREIITLQLGNYANYVGTHWWNIQESCFNYDPNATGAVAGDIDHDTLFREGRNVRGDVTYTPRLLLVDLKGALKHLPRSGGDLYGSGVNADEASADLCGWTASVDIVRAELAVKPPFQKVLDGEADDIGDDADADAEAADNDNGGASTSAAAQSTVKPSPATFDFSRTVETWTDYMYARYHPRSINIIDSLQHSADEAALDTYTAGAGIWQRNIDGDGDGGELADRIRLYIEECNSCQGFQLLFDGDDGFAGMAGSCLQHLRDEYGKTVMAVPLFAGRTKRFALADAAMSDSVRVVNIAMSYANALADPQEGAALMVPLSMARQAWRSTTGQRPMELFDGYDVGNAYETGAVLATYLDTITGEYRCKGAANTLAAFCSSLNNYGRRLAGAALALPMRMGRGELLIETLDKAEVGELMAQLSPNTTIGTDRVVQHVSARGLRADRLKKPLATAGEQIRMAAYGCDTAAEMLQLYFQCNMYANLTHARCSERGMPVRRPFPVQLFDGGVTGPDGWWEEKEEEGGSAGTAAVVANVPVLAAVRTSCDLARTVETLHREAARVKVAKIPRFAAAGMEADELAEALERLLEFGDNYDDAFEL